MDAEPVGNITAIGPGAGAGATASAVLADLADMMMAAAPVFRRHLLPRLNQAGQ